jgi:hypothetical protein
LKEDAEAKSKEAAVPVDVGAKKGEYEYKKDAKVEVDPLTVRGGFFVAEVCSWVGPKSSRLFSVATRHVYSKTQAFGFDY